MSELKKPEIGNKPAFYCPDEILSHAEYKGRKSALKESEVYYTSLLERLEATAKELFLVTDDTVYLKDVLDLIKQAKVQK